MGVIIIILVAAGLLYLGISTGVLWTLLGGLASAIGSFFWELFKAIGNAIGTFFANILIGIGKGLAEGILAVLKVIALPALIAGLVWFVCYLICKKFFHR